MLALKSLPLKSTYFIAPLILLIIALLAFIFDDALSELLIYNRQLIDHGEYWRIFTGHLFHTNDNHLLLNAAALTLLWALHGQYYSPKNYSLILLIAALTCSLGIHWFSPDIILYVGLSGVLHGVFIWGALMDIKHHEKTGYLLLLGVIAKLIHEQYYGPSQDVEAFVNASVAIDAHLYGAIGGTITFFIMWFYLKNHP